MLKCANSCSKRKLKRTSWGSLPFFFLFSFSKIDSFFFADNFGPRCVGLHRWGILTFANCSWKRALIPLSKTCAPKVSLCICSSVLTLTLQRRRNTPLSCAWLSSSGSCRVFEKLATKGRPKPMMNITERKLNRKPQEERHYLQHLCCAFETGNAMCMNTSVKNAQTPHADFKQNSRGTLPHVRLAASATTLFSGPFRTATDLHFFSLVPAR